MPKPRKTKVLAHELIGDRFTIATTVHGSKSERTLRGEPRVEVTDDHVRVGCMLMTHEAVAHLATLAKHFKWHGKYVHQEGNY